MKLHFPASRAERGNILIVSLCTMLIIGLALLTYLQLGKNQNQLVARSQVWNACLPVAEAGLEDALNHCAWNYTNWVSNGWRLSSTNTYYRSNTISEGWYRVIIATNAAASNQVTITSTGYFPMPGSGTYVPRSVQVKAFKMPIYKFAIMSKHAIDFNGNGCRIDSYDSRDPLKSTFGLYDPLKAGDKADISTYVGSPFASYDAQNGNIWGHVYMGPGGTVKYGPQGKVGDVLWQKTGPSSGIEPGWVRTDLNITIPDAVVPFSGGVPPLSNVTIDGVKYDYVFDDGYFQMATLTGKAIVTGDAMIYVTGNVNANIFRIQTNCSARLFCGGSFQFNDTDNQTQRAINFEILGLPTCKSFVLDNEFLGAAYAPQASVTITGQKQIYGCVVADSLKLSGGADIHFDEALRTGDTKRKSFIITSWTEL